MPFFSRENCAKLSNMPKKIITNFVHFSFETFSIAATFNFNVLKPIKTTTANADSIKNAFCCTVEL